MALRLFSFSRPSTADRSWKKRRRTLHCEHLESRQLLAVVTSLANAGPGTLREAVLGSDPVITFAISGTINLTTQLIVNRSLTIDGTGQNVTINNTAANQRIFSVVAGESTFRNLTITGGQVTSSSPNVFGGGIRLNAATLTVENTTVANSTAVQGGGIAVTGGGELFLVNSIVRNNFASDSGGGLVTTGGATINVLGSTIESNEAGQNSTDGFLRIGGGIAIFANALIRDSIIRDNECTTPLAGTLGWGGGIGVYQTSGSVLIENTEISGNHGDRGGGITTRLSNITVRGSNISGNSSYLNGGGIRIMRIPAGPGVINIENTTFEGNVADGGGAIGSGVYLDSEQSTTTLNITGSTFFENESAFDGGAVETFGSNTTITNSTFVNNSTENEGGGIWNSFDETFTGQFAVNFSTITGNAAVGNGGGLFSGEGDVSLDNTLLAGNTAAGGYGADLYDPTYLTANPLEAHYTLVEDLGGHFLIDGVDGNIIGQAPNLGPLADNGGPTRTRMLLTGPGVDGADPSSSLAVDQRGYTRPGANTSRDIGAVEHDGSPATFNLDFNNDGLYDCADMNLLETAIDAGSPVATYDVNGDGLLTSADVYAWLVDAGEVRFGAGRPFKQGDANLDGAVDGSDFGIWNAAKFTTANRWCQGDFNQDNSVDGSDFGIWNANKFTASDAGRPSSGYLTAAQQRFAEARRNAGGKRMIEEMATTAADASVQLPQSRGSVAAEKVSAGKSELATDVAVAIRTPMAPAPAIAITIRSDNPTSLRTGAQQNPARESIFEAMAEKDWLAVL